MPALRTSVVCSLLGLATSVATAWGCDLFGASHGISPLTASAVRRGPRDAHNRTFVAHSGEVYSGFGWTMRTFYGRDPAEPTRGLHVLESDAGIPLRCLSHHDTPYYRIGAVRDGHDTLHGRIFELPLVPIWPGLFVNSVVFGLGLWLLLRGHVTARAIYRAHQHRCVSCGYPAGPSRICTECGQPHRA